ARPPAAAQQPAPDAEDPQAAPERGGVAWRIGALLLALGAGFALGWRMLDRRIRRRYGGLRIY
ncbi:MAG: hypothetical protein ACREQ5_37325, partial [Candidatus Dormibacteria bacterium]